MGRRGSSTAKRARTSRCSPVNLPRKSHEIPIAADAPALGFLATAALAGAFLAGALLDFDFSGPDVGTVRLNDLTAEFLAASVRGADSPEASAQAARTWGAGLERALKAVAERHGVVLLPAEAVAAGARDYTAEVRAAMRWAAPVSTAYGETESAAAGSGEYPDIMPETRP